MDDLTLFRNAMRQELECDCGCLAFADAITVTVSPGVPPADVEIAVRFWEQRARSQAWEEARDYYRPVIGGLVLMVCVLLVALWRTL